MKESRRQLLKRSGGMFLGSTLGPGKLGIAFARAHQGEKVATVAASDVLCGSIEAAMANGMLAHSDETDDSHAASHSHPGCAVIPAALATAENFGNIDGTK